MFEKWELRLLYKPDLHRSLLPPPPDAPLIESTVVFHLPPLQEFGGLNKKVARVDPRARTHEVLYTVFIIIILLLLLPLFNDY